MESFEDFVSQYAQDIPENTTQTHNSSSLSLIAEKVRFCACSYNINNSLWQLRLIFVSPSKVNLDDLKANGRRFSAG